MEEIILKEREFKEKIVEIINNSKLPAFILKYILKELIEQVNIIEQQQYATAYNNVNKGKEKDNEKKIKSQIGGKNGEN